MFRLLLLVPLIVVVSGVRKILKKHDKQIRDKLIATHYLSTRAQEKYSFMRQLYNNEGIMSLVASLRRSVPRWGIYSDACSLEVLRYRGFPFSMILPLFRKFFPRADDDGVIFLVSFDDKYRYFIVALRRESTNFSKIWPLHTQGR